MAVEAVVSSLLSKLVDSSIKEALLLYGVHDQVEWIKTEMEQMKAYLKDADNRKQENESIKNWVAQVRDAACKTEDVIDDLILREEEMRMMGFARRCVSFICNKLITDYMTAKKIKRIKDKISDISKRRITYGIQEDRGRDEAPTSISAKRLHEKRQFFSLCDDSENIIAQDEGLKALEGRLIVEEPQCRCVISVVGMGGIGKTTIVKKIFRSSVVKSHFNCHGWVYVSQTYKIKELLQDVAKEVMDLRKEDTKDMDEGDLVKKLKEFLRDRRYLVVFDDVWETHVWDCIKAAFPDEKNGSRIVFTTRIKEVATHADPNIPIHKPELLNDDDSWALFSRKVSMPADSSSDQKEEIREKILKRCRGLPLAIVLLAGLLSTKQESYREWFKVLERINWQPKEDETQCSEILALSYNDLPSYLKPCFLYFGIFPEDFKISVQQLIRLWVAEGLAKQRGEEIAEDVAEDYLLELINRSMVQVEKMDEIEDRVKTCRIHDLLRDLSLEKAKEDLFLGIHPSQSSLTLSRYRRISIHRDIKNIFSQKPDPHLRSLFKYSRDYIVVSTDIIGRVVRNFKMLTVLELNGIKFDELPKDIRKLIHLRYLGLRVTGAIVHPSSIRNLRNLRTLDLLHTGIQMHGRRGMISKMQQLRHLSVENDIVLDPPTCNDFNSPRNLQTLEYLRLNRDSRVKDGWDRHTNLRRLCLSDHIEMAISEWIVKLNRLEELRLDCECFHLSLEKVWFKKLPNPLEFTTNLTTLYLRWLMLEEDPMPVLGKLPKLKFLRLHKCSLRGKAIVCLRSGFLLLRRLDFFKIEDWEEWRVEEGALPSLRRLKVSLCEKLKMLPDGLRHVTTLQELDISVMPNEFKDRMKENVGEDWDKIKHVRSITMEYP